MGEELNDSIVADYLVKNNYHLTALELLSETYERTGIQLENLSSFFELSSNFLEFDPNMSINNVDTQALQADRNSFADAMRIKDNRIAILEHENNVLQDKIKEMENKPAQPKIEKIEVKEPAKSIVGNITDAEKAILLSLILRFLQKNNFKMSSISFSNESGAGKNTDFATLPENVDLIHLLRTYLVSRDTPKLQDTIERLNQEKAKQVNEIAQLSVDLDFARKQIAELKQSIKTMKEANQQALEEALHGSAQEAPIVTMVAEPPSVQLLDEVFKDIEPLIKVIDDKEKHRLLPPLQTIIKNHPVFDKRNECIGLLFNLWEDPEVEERQQVVQALKACSDNKDRVESEILPYITQMMGSNNPNMLCLVSKTVAEFSSLAPMQMRSTLLLSVIRQLAEHSSSMVRASAAADGAKLVLSFDDDEDSADKLPDLVDLGKQFVFDSDAEVQSAGLCAYIPAVLRFAQLRKCVGTSCFEYWMKLALSFGLTGASTLAVHRFKLCAQVLETTILFFVPPDPRPEQRIVCETSSAKNEDDIVIAESEYNWLVNQLTKDLTQFSPILFVQIPAKKEAAQLVAKCCRAMGVKFTSSNIAPAFLDIIDNGTRDQKLAQMAMYIASVCPCCDDNEEFIMQARKYINQIANETNDMKQTDLQSYLGLAFQLLSGRDKSKIDIIIRLIEELSKSSRVVLRSSAVEIINQILPNVDSGIIETRLMSILGRLQSDPDEEVSFYTITCIASIARFTSSAMTIGAIKDYFQTWFGSNTSIRIQALRSITSVIADIDLSFRDTYILPRLLEIARSNNDSEWGAHFDQAMTIIIQILSSITDITTSVQQQYIVPLIQTLSSNSLFASDPMLNQLHDKYC